MSKDSGRGRRRIPEALSDQELAAAAGASTAGRIPGHTPEWTDLNDSDPGLVAFDPKTKLGSRSG